MNLDDTIIRTKISSLQKKNAYLSIVQKVGIENLC